MITHSESKSSSQENVLVDSIKQAKERFLKSKSSRPEFDNSSDKKISSSFTQNPKNTTAAAEAIKNLRNKVQELETLNEKLKRSNNDLKKQLALKERQLSDVESKKDGEGIVEEYRKKFQTASKTISELEAKISFGESALTSQRTSDLEEELSKKEKYLRSVERKVEESKEIQSSLEEKIQELNKRNDRKQNLISQLIKELDEEKERGREDQGRKMKGEKSQDFPIIIEESNLEKDKFLARIAQSDEEWSNTKAEKNNKSTKQENNFSIVSIGKSKPRNAELQKLKEKNEELFRIAKNYEKKNKAYEKQKRELKDKFYKLKMVVGDLIEQIQKLPPNLSQQFKLLIVKVNKLDGNYLQCLRSNSSQNLLRSDRGSGSKDRSGSKKPLKMEDLNSSVRSLDRSKSASKHRKKSGALLESHSGKKMGKKRGSQNEEWGKAIMKKIRMKRKEICTIQKILQEQTDSETKKLLESKLNALWEEELTLQKEVEEVKNIKGKNMCSNGSISETYL